MQSNADLARQLSVMLDSAQFTFAQCTTKALQELSEWRVQALGGAETPEVLPPGTAREVPKTTEETAIAQSEMHHESPQDTSVSWREIPTPSQLSESHPTQPDYSQANYSQPEYSQPDYQPDYQPASLYTPNVRPRNPVSNRSHTDDRVCLQMATDVVNLARKVSHAQRAAKLSASFDFGAIYRRFRAICRENSRQLVPMLCETHARALLAELEAEAAAGGNVDAQLKSVLKLLRKPRQKSHANCSLLVKKCVMLLGVTVPGINVGDCELTDVVALMYERYRGVQRLEELTNRVHAVRERRAKRATR